MISRTDPMINMLDLLVQGRLPEDALQQLPKVIG